ncbi:MAG: Clp protease ClpP [Bacillota bacterium]|nr:Clp protease ClpP [Bacillota bacterium]
MVKILEFKSKNKAGKEKINGKMEIKNQSESSTELYFYGDICGATWDKWQDEDKCPQDVADFLNQLEGSKDINIYINSGGGDAFAGLAIYNTLKRNTANKIVHVDGLAASAASVIALAGDKVIIPTTSQLMIHKAWTFAMGNADDMRKRADDLDKCDESILNVYMENAKEDVEIGTMKQLMANTTWMTGDDAAQYFNIDVEEGTKAAAYADSQFFNVYNNVPKCITEKNKQKPQSNTNNSIEKDEEIEALIKRVNNELKNENFEEE